MTSSNAAAPLLHAARPDPPPPPATAGVSRSAAVVAALVMKAKQLEPYDALVILRRAAPGAAPNAGFRDQLGVWSDMGWALDERHPAYKAFMLDQVGKSGGMGGNGGMRGGGDGGGAGGRLGVGGSGDRGAWCGVGVQVRVGLGASWWSRGG